MNLEELEEDIKTERFTVLTGGRMSGKTHAIVRTLLNIASKETVNIKCPRTHPMIDNTLYYDFKKILEPDDYTVYQDRIEHNVTKSKITFPYTGLEPLKFIMKNVDIIALDDVGYCDSKELLNDLMNISENGINFIIGASANVRFHGTVKIHRLSLQDNPYVTQERKDEIYEYMKEASDERN